MQSCSFTPPSQFRHLLTFGSIQITRHNQLEDRLVGSARQPHPESGLDVDALAGIVGHGEQLMGLLAARQKCRSGPNSEYSSSATASAFETLQASRIDGANTRLPKLV